MYEAARNIDLAQGNIQSVSSILSRLRLVIRTSAVLINLGQVYRNGCQSLKKKTPSYVNYSE
jgi:hypothetical protein